MGWCYKILGTLGLALAAVAVALCSGADLATGPLASAIRSRLATVEGVQISFDQLQGNPVAGYRLLGVEVALEGETVATADSLEAALMGRLRSRVALRLQLRGLGVRESLVPDLISAIRSLSGGDGAAAPVEVQRLELVQAASLEGRPWRIQEASAELQSLEGRYHVSLLGAWQGEELELKGSVAADGSALDLTARALEGELALRGSSQELELGLEGLDLARAVALVPLSLEPGQLQGQLAAELALTAPLGDRRIRGRATLSGGRLAWRNHRAEEVELKLELVDSQAEVDLAGLWMDNGIRATGLVHWGPQPELDIRVSASELDLASLERAFPKLERLALAGSAQAQALVRGLWSDPDVALRAQSPEVSVYGQALEGAELELRASRKELELQRLVGTWMGGRATATGSVRDYLKGAATGTFRVRGEGLEGAQLSRLLPVTLELSAHNALEVTVTLDRGVARTSFTATALELSLPGQPALKDLNIAGQSLGRGLELTELRARFLEGILSGQGRLDWAQGQRLNLEGRLSELDLARVDGPMELEGQVEGRFSLAGEIREPQLELELDSPRLRIASLGLRDVALKLQRTPGQRAQVALRGVSDVGGALAGTGTLELRGLAPGEMNLRAILADLDLGSLLDRLPLGGRASLELDLTGPLGAPQVQFRLTGPALRWNGLVMEAPDLRGRLQGQRVDLEASVGLGDQRPRFTGSATLGESWQLQFQGQGQDLDPRKLKLPLPQALEARLGFSVEGDLTAQEGLQASGTLRAISSENSGAAMVEGPFQVSGQAIALEGRGTFCGGDVDLKAQGDLGSRHFSSSLAIRAIQLAQLWQNLEGPGDVRGLADLTLEGRAVSAMALLMSLSGTLKLTELEIDGLPYLKLFTSGSPLRIREARVIFTADPDELFIMPGSVASAWPGDRFFRYLAVSGSLWRRGLPEGLPLFQELAQRGPLGLDVSGNVNVRALNGLLQGVGVLFQSSREGASGKELATDFLKGLFGGAKDQFRDIFFRVTGDYRHLEIQDLQVENEIQIYDPDNSWTNGVVKRDTEPNYKFQFRIPVGPGTGKADSVGQQATGQILGNLVEGLVGGS